MRLLAGTSGYSYKEWKGSFYPQDLAADEMLRYYSGRLPAVEINNTFYRLPRASVLETWAGQVPPGFRFAVKASRRITHLKRLRNAGDETGYLLDTVQVLGERLGVVLFQLPPDLKKDLDRLRDFLALVRGRARAVLEFRHPTWLDDEVLGCLQESACALCVSDTDEEPAAAVTSTAPFGYLRLRRSEYSDSDLSEWARRVGAHAWDEAYVFFKHEEAGAGPRLAARFLELARMR